MRLRKLVQDDDAVSPVIGVILMVAITVILAAVIASFVLGLGGQTQTTPQTSFAWDWDVSTSDVGNLSITHDSGESVKTTELFVRGDPGNGSSISVEWAGSASTTIGSTSAVASGDSYVLSNGTNGDTEVSDMDSSYDFRVVWQPEEGDTSATLGEDTGPDN